jgi:hypothetical protein
LQILLVNLVHREEISREMGIKDPNSFSAQDLSACTSPAKNAARSSQELDRARALLVAQFSSLSIPALLPPSPSAIAAAKTEKELYESADDARQALLLLLMFLVADDAGTTS